MKLCPSCDRHLFGPEPACPFCGAEQATTPARQSGGLASLTLAFALGTAACGPIVEPEQTEGSSSSPGDETMIPPGTTAPPPTTSTTGVTTGDPDTDAPMTTTIEATTTSDDGDSSCAFYAGCPPDISRDPFECDVFAQDCPEGEKCMPWANDGGTWNATRCSPIVDNPGQPGDECTVEGGAASGIDSCDLGSQCWDVDPETNMGVCAAMCTGDASNPLCEDPDTTCSIANDGAIVLCLGVCDPIVQDCPEGQACYPVAEDWVCGPDASGEMGTYGDPCEFINVCDPGLMCLDASATPNCAGASGCCTEVCDITDPEGDAQCTGAPDGQTCTPWYEEGTAPPGYEDVGACALPA
jgi:hypothetical protein